MKVISILFVTTCIMSYSYNQIIDPNWKNLVPNYSFEVVTQNYPVNKAGDPNDFYSSGPPYKWTEKYWAEVYEWTHPLKRQPICISQHAVGTANVLPDGRSGSNRGHGSNGEFLVTPLWHEGMKLGKLYFIEFFKFKGGGEKVYFSNGQTQQCGNDIKRPRGSDGIMTKAYTTNNNGPNNWERIKFYYTSPINLDWMTLGVKGDAGDGVGGASWDDLRIYEVQGNGCRDNWYFDNTVFNYPFEFFQASDKIYVGNGVDPENGVNHIPGDVIQYSGTDIVLQAGNQVVIDNTFIMEPGSSTLIIENKPCNDDLCPDELTFEDEILCDIPSLQIGATPNQWGTSVTWSPSTHLDNPNIANPTFTSPGGIGTINYNVIVNYTCGDDAFNYSSSYPVTVQYTDNNNTDATISVTNTDWDVYNFSTDFEVGEGVTEITISIISPPGYEETFYVGEDFSSSTFNWDLPDAWKWSSCHDDEIIVTAKNGCSEVEETISIDWPKTQIPFQDPPQLPNVITPDGDGVNDKLWINIPSADNYFFSIQNRWGNQILDIFEESEGEVKSDKLIIFSPSQYEYTNGVYYYLIEYSDLCGNNYEADMFFHLYNGNSGIIQNGNNTEDTQVEELMDNLDNNSQDELLLSLENDSFNNTSILIYPNPTNGLINIVSEDSRISNINIYDYKGALVYSRNSNQNNISLEVSNIAAGIYWVEVHNEQGVNRQKVSMK